ncbi:MAG: hypothetical protein D6813_02575 [Calditrichaeota bacterium]|nr:MAG: hypothetical protein D6813_02575 [Calditrichota bacterium]
MTIDLNENHRRALRVALREVERALEEFERLLDQTEKEKKSDADVGSDRVAAVRAKIEATRGLLNGIRLHLGVSENRPTDPWWAIRVGVSRLWEMLEDCKSERMRGYGEVPQASKEALDHHIQQLIDALEEISKTAQK